MFKTHIISSIFFCFLVVAGNSVKSQEKERTVSVSCYVNPELYIQASIIAQVSNDEGRPTCNGKYVSIHNKSRNSFSYKSNNKWLVVKPQAKALVPFSIPKGTSPKSPSVFKLTVRYKPEAGNISAKLNSISQMNAETDRLQAQQLGADVSKPKEQLGNRPPAETEEKATKPAVVNPSPASAATPAKPESTRTTVKPTKKATVARAKPKSQPKPNRPASVAERGSEKASARTSISANALGLRIDFGSGAAGIGPNLKHKFNKNTSLDAAVVFYEAEVIGLVAQFERNFPLKGSPGLDWYIGIGPQILLGNGNAVGVVPVTGLEYTIPRSPVNFSIDWRPAFYISPTTYTTAKRFGLSLRVAL